MLYLEVKYRSNEVSLRVEYSSLTQTLLGLEAILCSAECWVRLFETFELPVHITSFGGLWVGTRFSLHLFSSIVDPFDLRGEDGKILRTSHSEIFLKCKMSIARTASSFPFGALQGPADPNPWQLCSDGLGRGRSAAGETAAHT